ncbi:PA4780 family RIO1-like protein kinase [Aliiglaciecola sp. 2_MG-2023]|uniref:PA4780 family RIO1-like protein kinase n=1 Tax=unclassified Aliiglaciecola TaxID=2593648 RepID=UPI0026E28D99|nr:MULTISPECIES: PA4780 family RIO1-like protein kinase [unclassified Aliiglaciecola]MDO6709398.1 PA4780 family RIO1-like protein kinase [Aliiglaciecola sp. 2_MG-2023]MDO6750546.1 PA4780 family RIO1-like protein kinase [Aliiglaciecola sp. 1_MG-2023]
MKIPKRLQPLVEDGLIDEVLYQLMSGKEATVFVVKSQGEIRCAKVYKEAMKRSFKKAAQYQEGRKVKNSRRARAMEKGSKFGRKQQEDAWQNAEVDALFTLSKTGVRVPQPFGCYDGVLLMELVTVENGDVAPRLNDVSMSKEQALEDHAQVMFYVMLMLCCGLVHGDLSEFNVLVDDYGPVIIDLPQAVNAAANNNAFSMLQRDVRNMTDYYAEFAPELRHTHYAEEMWALFEAGELTPESVLTGQFEFDESAADVDNVLEEIKAAFAEEEERLARIRAADSDE